MKISFQVLKSFLPGLKTKAQVMDALSLFAFEAEDAEGSLIDVKLPPNRYSDAGSYVGIARELSAILNLKGLKEPNILIKKPTKTPKHFSVRVEDVASCPRYCAEYFDRITIQSSPKWLHDALIAAGMRPINNVVDVMNYVMLETGQPLHAFDYDALLPKGNPELHIRRAKKGESILSLDNIQYELDPDILLIADKERPLVIAGIKGGIGCEVSDMTSRIIVEAANFDSVQIYRTTKKINLSTDASQRFVHKLSPALAEYALSRASFLLKEVVGARSGDRFDSLKKPLSKKILKFDIEKANLLLGSKLKEKEAADFLKRLGFKDMKKNLWEVPSLRVDIETPEDLAEEVVRIFGYNNLKPEPPRAFLIPPEENPTLFTKEKIRGILRGFGFDEVYNYSFVAREDLEKGVMSEGMPIELANPISGEFQYLRPSLALRLIKNTDQNFRFSDSLKMFEIGNVFHNEKGKMIEETHMGIVLAAKDKDTFFDLKGTLDYLLKGFGITDFRMVEVKNKKQNFIFEHALSITIDGQHAGYAGFSAPNVSIAELNVEIITRYADGAHGFQGIEKFPSVMRDISFFTDLDTRIGELIEAIEVSQVRYVKDVDLLDEYVDEKWAGLQSIALRVIFQAPDKTLTSEEVDGEMKKILEILQKEFHVRLR